MPRSTIEFSNAAETQLNRLTDRLSIKSKAEVVRNALTLYDYIVKELQARPNLALGIVNEDSGNRVEKVIIVPGIVAPNLATEAEKALAAVV